jgi:hypothetical protein
MPRMVSWSIGLGKIMVERCRERENGKKREERGRESGTDTDSEKISWNYFQGGGKARKREKERERTLSACALAAERSVCIRDTHGATAGNQLDIALHSDHLLGRQADRQTE